MAAKNSSRLKVASAQQLDVGKGIIRIGADEIRSLALERGDIIEIKGKGVTAAIPVPAHQEDEGLDIVRMDGLIRSNAKVGIGEFVEIKKGDWKEAKKVSLAPAKEGLRIAGSGE
ncbi:MAG: AAA family ATPase, partial [Candidatus Binatia bacterium]